MSNPVTRRLLSLGALSVALFAACAGGRVEAPPPASTTRAPVTSNVTFTSAQTDASPTCPEALKTPRDQRITGAGTWTVTPGDRGTYQVAASYESGAQASGTLTVATRVVALENDDGAVPGWARRQRRSTLTLNEAFDRATGTSQSILTPANGTECTLAYELSLTFATPLLPPGTR